MSSSLDRRDGGTHEPTGPIFAPKIEILPGPEAVDMRAAEILMEQVRTKPDSILTLPTGSTPIGMYDILIEAYQHGLADFSGVTTLNLDEYYPIDPRRPESYAGFMQDHLFDHVPFKASHIPNGAAEDPEAEARRYEDIIASNQPVDLAVISLGPGTTCHIAFNERGSSADSRVRYITLDPQTTTANSRFFENPWEVPVGAITQGVANILEARHILFIAKGEHKAWGVNRSLKGPVSSDAPASFLRLHPNVTAVLDQAAAQYLK